MQWRKKLKFSMPVQAVSHVFGCWPDREGSSAYGVAAQYASLESLVPMPERCRCTHVQAGVKVQKVAGD